MRIYSFLCVSVLLLSGCASAGIDQSHYSEPMHQLDSALINDLVSFQEQGTLTLTLVASSRADVAQIAFFLQKYMAQEVLVRSFSDTHANLIIRQDVLAQVLGLLQAEYTLMLGEVRVNSYQATTMYQQLLESYRLSESLYERIIELTDNELERAQAGVELQAVRRERIEREDTDFVNPEGAWSRLRIVPDRR